MRYKIRASDDDAYRDLLGLLEGKVRIFVASPRRRMLGTGELPVEIRRAVRARGGTITKDYQYALELPRLNGRMSRS